MIMILSGINSFIERRKKKAEKIEKKETNKNINSWFAVTMILIVIVAYLFGRNSNNSLSLFQGIKDEKQMPIIAQKQIEPTQQPAIIKTNQIIPRNTPTQKSNSTDNREWGKAIKIDDKGGYAIKVGKDTYMATPQEIFQALNHYRSVHGRGQLSWDNGVASYAQSRAEYYNKIGNDDAHAGFIEFRKSASNFDKLNCNYLGENSGYIYNLIGVHIIEWVFGSDSGHDELQLDTKWTHVGIGVNGRGVDLIFCRR